MLSRTALTRGLTWHRRMAGWWFDDASGHPVPPVHIVMVGARYSAEWGSRLHADDLEVRGQRPAHVESLNQRVEFTRSRIVPSGERRAA